MSLCSRLRPWVSESQFWLVLMASHGQYIFIVFYVEKENWNLTKVSLTYLLSWPRYAGWALKGKLYHWALGESVPENVWSLFAGKHRPSTLKVKAGQYFSGFSTYSVLKWLQTQTYIYQDANDWPSSTKKEKKQFLVWAGHLPTPL